MAETKQEIVAELAVLDSKESTFVPSEMSVDGVEKASMFSEEYDPNDEKDPKNWTPTTKLLIFVSLMFSSLLCDGGMTWGATLIVPQSFDWHISIDKSATSMNYGILLQGFGGILAVPLIEAYGRLPTWFWTQLLTLLTLLGCTLSPSFPTFTAFRSLQGLFGTIPQVVGLPLIHDLYHPRDWPRMINIWGTAFLVGPFVGPALAGYIFEGTQSWRSSFAVLAGLYGASTLAIVVCGRETFYRRGKGTQEAVRWKTFLGVGNTGSLGKLNTIGVQSKDLVVTMFKLPMLLIGIATMINFTWPIGITVTISTILHSPPYLFTNLQASSMRWSGVLGALLGWLLGHFFNLYLHRRRSTSPSWRPETRLHGVWLPITSMACGLVLYGLTLHFSLHWALIAVAWVLVNIGMIASTVAITAFAMEKYPNKATIVAAIVNMWRTCGGFAVGYFQPQWIERDGVAVVFAVQAAVVVGACVVFVVPVVLLGRRRGVGEGV